MREGGREGGSMYSHAGISALQPGRLISDDFPSKKD